MGIRLGIFWHCKFDESFHNLEVSIIFSAELDLNFQMLLLRLRLFWKYMRRSFHHWAKKATFWNASVTFPIYQIEHFYGLKTPERLKIFGRKL